MNKVVENVSKSVRGLGRTGMLRRAAILTTMVALLLAAALPVAADSEEIFPPVFTVSTGDPPEGIAVGRGSSYYVTSLLDGAVFGGDLRTGDASVVVQPQDGRGAVGLAVDVRSNAIFVAGGGALLGVPGSAYVYDAATGDPLAEYLFNGGLVNDVVIARDAAYFTDSFQPVIYRVPLGPGGEFPVGPTDFAVIDLDAGFDVIPGINANGIVVTPNGKWLIIAHTDLGNLYRVDPRSGETVQIDLGGVTLPGADGLVLAGKTLYVAQNSIDQVGVVELDPSLTSGTVSAEPLISPDYNAPTTVARFGSTIYAVNARFPEWLNQWLDDPTIPPDPDLVYTVVGLPMK